MPNISASRKALIGRPCLTCQRRKIKCDRAKPDCQRCQKAGLSCEGYTADSFVLVVPSEGSRDTHGRVRLRRAKGTGTGTGTGTDNGDEDNTINKQTHEIELSNAKKNELSRPSGLYSRYINAAPENRMQVLSYFLERYLPASMAGGKRTFVTPSSWIRNLPNQLGRWEGLDAALCGLCLAYIGDVHKNEGHLHESQRFYNNALRQMGSMSLETLKSANEGVLTTTMTMAMYELFHSTCGRLQGWMIHVRGASRLLELRGPPTKEAPLNMSLYDRIRNTTLWDAYGSRKMTYLARREWQNLSQHPHDVLLDTLLCIPGLLESYDNILSSSQSCKADIDSLDDLLSCWHAIHLRLTQWFLTFEEEESDGLYEIGPLDPNNHPYLDPDQPHMYAVFPQVLSFHDLYVAQVMIMYWFGQLVAHTSMLQIYATKEKSQTRLKTKAFPSRYDGIQRITIENVQKAGDYYASKICQSTAKLKGGYGFQIVMVPLWAAQVFYDICQNSSKFHWCQTVLRSFGTSCGFPTAEALGFLRPSQYPGLEKKGNVIIDDI